MKLRSCENPIEAAFYGVTSLELQVTSNNPSPPAENVEVVLAGDAGAAWSLWRIGVLARLGEAGFDFIRHIADGRRAEFFRGDAGVVLGVRLSDDSQEHFDLVGMMQEQGASCFYPTASVRALEENAYTFNAPINLAVRLGAEAGLEALKRGYQAELGQRHRPLEPT
jgi:hypothetical protein